MNNTSFRLLTILQQIPREPLGITTHELHAKLAAAGYEVSLRTVQRDLNSLSAEFPLIQLPEVTKNVRWAFAKQGRLVAFPGMDAVTALTVYMAEEHLKNLLPVQVADYLQPWQQEARSKLTDEYKGWLKKIRVVNPQPLQPPQLNSEVLQPLYQALLENRQLAATYNGATERIIHPYGLVQKGQLLYLVCRFYEFDDVRITALQRYSDVTLLDEKVRPFPKFNIDDYLEEGRFSWLVSNQLLKLSLEITPSLAELLKETPLATNQKFAPLANCPKNNQLLTAEVADTLEVRRWLLSQGSAVKVLEPQEVRTWLADEAKAMYENYKPNTSCMV